MKTDDDVRTLEELRALGPREAYRSIRRALLENPHGSASEDFQAALERMVHDGILTWDQVEEFEES